MDARIFIAGFLGLSAVLSAVLSKTKKMRYPLAVNTVTSPFGDRIHPVTHESQFHNGIDLAGKVGTVVAAPYDGYVSRISLSETGGNQLYIKHDNGFTSFYAHLSKYAVKLNDRVTQSQVIAYVGATGRVTGPHLHFSLINPSGDYVNPVDYLV